MTTSIHEGELDATLNSLPDPPRKPRGKDDPLMPFETELRLTRTQEERLVQHVLKRLGEVEGECGAADVVGQDDAAFTNAVASFHAQGIKVSTLSWMVQRALFYRHFYNNYDDRVVADTIYAESNLTASISPRITLQTAGRLKKTFFGTDPWFSTSPVGNSDEGLARDVAAFTRYKAEEACVKDSLITAVDLACILGECVVKTTHVVDRLWYWRTGEILVTKDGVPVFDSAGAYVWKEDLFVPEMQEQQPDPSQPPELVATGRQVLRRDNSVVMQEGYTYRKDRVRVGDTLFRGVRSEPIRFTDFLCPLAAPTVEMADICFHNYDKSAMEVAQWFLNGRLEYLSNQQQIAVKADEALNLLKDIAATAGVGTGTGDSMTARREHGEQGLTAPGSSGMTSIIEAWGRFDADEDGVQEEFVILIDRRLKLPLYYEYTGLATDDRRRPFNVVRILPIHGRWYGQGTMSYLEPEQLFLDLLANRWNVTLSRSGVVVFWDPSKTIEGASNPDLVLNGGLTYRLREGHLASEVLQVIELYARDRAGDLKAMIEFIMQLMQLKTGTISVGDEAVANLESTELATGIRSLEKSGNELFVSWLTEAGKTVKAALEKWAAISLVRMDQRETFKLLEGDNLSLATLDRDDVTGLKMDVTLLLAADENDRVIAAFGAAMDVLLKFSGLPVHQQPTAVDMTIQALRALRIRNPETIPVPAPMMTPGAPGDGGEAAPAGAPPPLPEAI